MLQYVDQQLVADSSRTRSTLSWRPTLRKSITRRLVFLIENMKKNPKLWQEWNEAMLRKETDRPHLVLHELLCDALDAARDSTLESITRQLLDTDQPGLHAIDSQKIGSVDKILLHSYVRLLYQLIVTVIRTKNRPMMQQYAHTIAFLPMMVGFGSGLASHCLFDIGEFMIKRFRDRPQFKQLTPRADEYVTITIRMAVDQIEDQAELSRLQSPVMLEGFKQMPLPEPGELEQVMGQLEDLCSEAICGKSWSNPLVQG
jgi:hypothetical protein